MGALLPSLPREVGHTAPLPLGVGDSAGSAAAGAGEVTDAVAAVVDQMAVALVVTARLILFTHHDDLVRLALDRLVPPHIVCLPQVRLAWKWQNHNEFDVGILSL